MERKSYSAQRFLISVVGSILTVLFTGNVYFVKRLVDKIDATSDIVFDLRQSVAVMKVTIDNMSGNHGCCMGRDAKYDSSFEKKSGRVMRKIQEHGV